MTFNEQKVSNNADRVRVHLQSTLETGENEDKNLFYFVTSDNEKYNICPKSWTNRENGASLNPAKGNKNGLAGKNEGTLATSIMVPRLFIVLV